MKKLKKAFIILSCVILAIPISTFNFRPNQISAIDNRFLAELPGLNSATGIKKGIEEYISDRIGFREEMIRAYTWLNNKLFNMITHPNYTYGRGGYIFFNIESEKSDFDYIKDFADFNLKLQNYCNQRSVSYLYCLNPSKTTVYGEYLPRGIELKNERINYLIDCLNQNGVRYLYTAPALIEAKKEKQVFNIKYDPGHWNDNGAFVAISAILDELRKDCNTLEPLSRSQFNITEEEYTKLGETAISIRDSADVYTPKKLYAVTDKTFKNELKISKKHPFFAHYINPEKKDGLKLMVFRGSYFSGKEKFFVDQFSEVVLIHNYVNIVDFDYYFNIFKPDIVLFETAEYATDSLYFPQQSIANAEYQPAYSGFQSLPEKEFASLSASSVDSFKKRIKKQSTETALTDIELEITGERVKFAYARADDELFDFRVLDTQNGQKLKVTLKSNLVANIKTFQVILINENRDYQSVININLTD